MGSQMKSRWKKKRNLVRSIDINKSFLFIQQKANGDAEMAMGKEGNYENSGKRKTRNKDFFIYSPGGF